MIEDILGRSMCDNRVRVTNQIAELGCRCPYYSKLNNCRFLCVVCVKFECYCILTYGFCTVTVATVYYLTEHVLSFGSLVLR